MRGARPSVTRLWRHLALLLGAATLGLGSAWAVWTPLPEAAPLAPELVQRLVRAYETKGRDEAPRTAHRHPDGTPKYVNRLILEDSPYLLQHAYNPVDWHAWGAEAFDQAKRLGRPLFISIGYSTCHWCHVMERESFDDETIAADLNAHFVPIKVDRERRPDVDELYMTAALLSAGHGGWPLSVFALPDGRPFFVTTYLPPEAFRTLLERVQAQWSSARTQLEEAAEALAEAVAEAMAAQRKAGALDVGAAYERAVRELLADYDEFGGGFGTAPKFPEENRLLLLLDHVWRSGERHALSAVIRTLDGMARGGIYDQVGGGFHRYATDPHWQIPHFEKMLYNQARLARIYTRAWQLTGHAAFRRVARQTLDYVLEDLTAPQGGFYSARDADSEGREGAYYLWTPKALRQALGASDARLAIALFGVTEAGNFEGENILHLPESIEDFARSQGLSPEQAQQAYGRIRKRLRRARAHRAPPHRDEKVITAWNGMMIAALADASRILGEPCAGTSTAKAPTDPDCRYLPAARRAADYLLRAHRQDGRLMRLSLAGRPAVTARLQDHAWLIEGLLALYDADGEARWLREAQELARDMIEAFQDEKTGAFYLTARDAAGRLFTRPRSPVDGALPSGDAIAVRALARLAQRTGEPAFSDAAVRALASLSQAVQTQPTRFPYLLLAARALTDGPVGPLLYAARGKVRLAARLEPRSEPRRGRLRMEMRLWPRWHINAHDPGTPDLIPTTVALVESGVLAAAGPIVYPRAVHKALRFADQVLGLYEGHVVVELPVQARPPSGPEVPLGRVVVQVQACSDEVCLAPERPVSTVPLWPLLGPVGPTSPGE